MNARAVQGHMNRQMDGRQTDRDRWEGGETTIRSGKRGQKEGKGEEEEELPNEQMYGGT